jgi:hypothetical protein
LQFSADTCAACLISLLGAYSIAIVFKIKNCQVPGQQEKRENFCHNLKKIV